MAIRSDMPLFLDKRATKYDNFLENYNKTFNFKQNILKPQKSETEKVNKGIKLS